MNELRRLILALGAAAPLAACATAPLPPTSAGYTTDITTVSATEVPQAVLTVVQAAMPTMKVTEAELKVREGRRYYDVEGVLPNGDEVELDMLETPQGWTVVEIQRDIDWAAAPANVRSVAQKAGAATPVRVIESKQTDGRIIYELFAAGRPATPAMEVMLNAGQATLLTETWPH